MSIFILDEEAIKSVKRLKQFFEIARPSTEFLDHRFFQVFIEGSLICVTDGLWIASFEHAITETERGEKNAFGLTFDAVDALPSHEVAVKVNFGSYVSFCDIENNLVQHKMPSLILAAGFMHNPGPYSVTYNKDDFIKQLKGINDVVVGNTFFTDETGKTLAFVEHPRISFNPQLLIPALEELAEDDHFTLSYGENAAPIALAQGNLKFTIMPLSRSFDEMGKSHDRLIFSVEQLENA